MALFFLSIHQRSETIHKALYDELEKLQAVKVQDGTWCFDVDDSTSGEIRDRFKALVSPSDGLLVVQPRTWSTYNVEQSPSEAQKAK